MKQGINLKKSPLRLSLPSRERGLKLIANLTAAILAAVAPLAGAWIETKEKVKEFIKKLGRSPRGSVD